MIYFKPLKTAETLPLTSVPRGLYKVELAGLEDASNLFGLNS